MQQENMQIQIQKVKFWMIVSWFRWAT